MLAAGAISLAPLPAAGSKAVKSAPPAGAERIAENPREGEGALRYHILFDRARYRGKSYAEVIRPRCRRAGHLRLRCSFLVGTYDGDYVWRGKGAMRAHSFQGYSFRYRYRFAVRRRICRFPSLSSCRHRKLVWRGNDYNAHPDPNSE